MNRLILQDVRKAVSHILCVAALNRYNRSAAIMHKNFTKSKKNVLIIYSKCAIICVAELFDIKKNVKGGLMYERISDMQN